MLEILKSLSKHTLAFLILGVAVIFVVLSDPPVTVCSTQKEAFNKDMMGELTPDPKKKMSKEGRYQRLVEVCKTGNSVGSCYPLFVQMHRILDRSKSVSLECVKDIGDISVFESFLTQSIRIMVRIAWGEKPPTSVYDKNSWLENTDLALFCRLQKEYTNYYGDSAWTSLREKIMQELPESKAVGRDEVWKRSILSTNCSAY
jgi:hypothetical protein